MYFANNNVSFEHLISGQTYISIIMSTNIDYVDRYIIWTVGKRFYEKKKKYIAKFH